MIRPLLVGRGFKKKKVLEELFFILDSEFDRLGLLIKRGLFIDATIVQT